jgi:ornithine cyclodeaminase
VLVIPEQDIKDMIDMETVITAVTGAYRHYAERRIHVPDRITLDINAGGDSAIFLAANSPSMGYYGLKQASSFPTNMGRGKQTVFSEIHLYSAETGEIKVSMGANYLTALKTGAASAVATDFLAREDSQVLAIIGTGVQAKHQLTGIQAVRVLREVRLFDKDIGKADVFAKMVEKMKYKDLRVMVTETVAECVNGADILVTATTSSSPVLSARDIGEGTHINAVGSFTPDMQELDSETVLRADKIVTDQLDQTWAVAGDLLVPFKEGLISESAVYGELGDIVAGIMAGRESDKEITLYESVGFAALDLAVAIATYEKAVERGFGTEAVLYESC